MNLLQPAIHRFFIAECVAPAYGAPMSSSADESAPTYNSSFLHCLKHRASLWSADVLIGEWVCISLTICRLFIASNVTTAYGAPMPSSAKFASQSRVLNYEKRIDDGRWGHRRSRGWRDQSK
jgi:hypothetical protein